MRSKRILTLAGIAVGALGCVLARAWILGPPESRSRALDTAARHDAGSASATGDPPAILQPPPRESTAPVGADSGRGHARAAIEVHVHDEQGNAVAGLEVEQLAVGAQAWERLFAESFELLSEGTKIVLADDGATAKRLRIGAPWHQWTEVDVAVRDATVTLERAGSIAARIRNLEANERATVLLDGAGGETRIGASAEDPQLFERLRPGRYQLGLEVEGAAATTPPVDVEVEAGRTTRVFLEIPRADDARRGGLELTLCSPDLGACVDNLRLTVDVRPQPLRSAASADGADTRRAIEAPVGRTWTTFYRALRPGTYAVRVQPLGVRRNVQVEPDATARLTIDLGPIARTSVTFFDTNSGAQITPSSVVGSLRTAEGQDVLLPTTAAEGSGAFVFWSAPGQLGIDCDDPLWAAEVRSVDVRPGWNAAVVEVRHSARLRLRLEPGRVEVPASFWSRVVARRANGEIVALRRSTRQFAGGPAESRELELVLPAGEPIDVTTPAAIEREAQSFRVSLAAGETAERTVAVAR